MSAVEIRLSPSDLSRQMGAMRVWLDQHRFEASGFSCRHDEDGVLLSLEFKRAYEAQTFATRFGALANAPSLPETVEEPMPVIWESGTVG